MQSQRPNDRQPLGRAADGRLGRTTSGGVTEPMLRRWQRFGESGANTNLQAARRWPSARMARRQSASSRATGRIESNLRQSLGGRRRSYRSSFGIVTGHAVCRRETTAMRSWEPTAMAVRHPLVDSNLAQAGAGLFTHDEMSGLARPSGRYGHRSPPQISLAPLRPKRCRSQHRLGHAARGWSRPSLHRAARPSDCPRSAVEFLMGCRQPAGRRAVESVFLISQIEIQAFRWAPKASTDFQRTGRGRCSVWHWKLFRIPGRTCNMAGSSLRAGA